MGGLFGGASTLLTSITAKITDGVMNVQQSVMTNHTTRVYRGMLTGNRIGGGMKCAFRTMSQGQICVRCRRWLSAQVRH
jgi:hypothetical protein